METTDKPYVDLGFLGGQEGNAFVIMGRCKRAATEAGWTPEQFKEFRNKAESEDYEYLLKTVNEHFDADYIR